MNYKRVFVPNSYVHLIVVEYNRKDIFVVGRLGIPAQQLYAIIKL